jgi:hypothetical protein
MKTPFQFFNSLFYFLGIPDDDHKLCLPLAALMRDRAIAGESNFNAGKLGCFGIHPINSSW